LQSFRDAEIWVPAAAAPWIIRRAYSSEHSADGRRGPKSNPFADAASAWRAKICCAVIVRSDRNRARLDVDLVHEPPDRLRRSYPPSPPHLRIP